MNVAIILDILLALGGCLALIGLGGAVATWTRIARKSDITISVEVIGRKRQALTFSADSPVVKQLVPILSSINLFSTEGILGDEAQKDSLEKRRLLNRIGLVFGVTATSIATFPFIGEEIISKIGIIAGSLVLTRFGEILPRLIGLLHSQNWQKDTTEQKARVIAALFVSEEPVRTTLGNDNASDPSRGHD